MSVDLGSRFK